MGKPDLGAKLTCTTCNARFYDLLRSPAVCPKCDAVQPPPKPRASYPARGAARRWGSRPATPAAAEAGGEDVAAVEVEVDDDLDVVDPPEIDEDDDDDDVVKPEVPVDG